MAALTTLIVFAKNPVAGQVKTRLARHLGTAAATRLAHAFLLDTWRTANRIRSLRCVLAIAGDGKPPRLDPEPDELWNQGGGDLGERMERALRRGTRGGNPAILIGSDAPSRPEALLTKADQALRDGASAVIGPTRDGGYHLIGLRQVPQGLLRDLPWSSAQTLDATVRRLNRWQIRVHHLEPWYDIDELGDLNCLARELETEATRAPHTRAELESLRPLRHQSGDSSYSAERSP